MNVKLKRKLFVICQRDCSWHLSEKLNSKLNELFSWPILQSLFESSSENYCFLILNVGNEDLVVQFVRLYHALFYIPSSQFHNSTVLSSKETRKSYVCCKNCNSLFRISVRLPHLDPMYFFTVQATGSNFVSRLSMCTLYAALILKISRTCQMLFTALFGGLQCNHKRTVNFAVHETAPEPRYS